MKISSLLRMAARFPKDPKELAKYPDIGDLPIVHKIPHTFDTLEEAQARIDDINHNTRHFNGVPSTIVKMKKFPKRLFHWGVKTTIPVGREPFWIVNVDDAKELEKAGYCKIVN